MKCKSCGKRDPSVTCPYREKICSLCFGVLWRLEMGYE